MSQKVTELKFMFREAVKANATKLRGVQADRLTATAIAMMGVKKYMEGYHGQRFRDKLAEGRTLRISDPRAYAESIERNTHRTTDLRHIRGEVRIVESLTTSDLTYAIGATREVEQNDPRPSFQTDLYGLVRRRTRADLTPITTGGGVNLLDRFLAVRAEGTVHKKTGWIGRGETYSLANYELGFDLTWETLLTNKLDEWMDAMYELGEAAARTRAWLIVDAVRRGATRFTLPDGALGPNISNLTGVDSYLADQDIDGHHYSRNMTDLYLPPAWRATAVQALGTQNVTIIGGGNGAVTSLPNVNPIFGRAMPHVETILAEAPIDLAEFPGHSNKDYIAADASSQPVEFATLQGFEAGPLVLTRIPDIVELDTMGSFAEHIIETKISDVAAASVRDKSGIVLIAGV